MNALSRMASLLAPLLLTACATVGNSPLDGKTVPQAAAQPAVAEEAAAAPEPENDPKIPRQSLTAEWLYGLLAGEMAARYGGASVAADTYLQLARETRDPRIAKRASEFAMFSGKVKEASEALGLWVELDPDADEAREQLLIALLRSGKLADSKLLIENMLERQPKRAGALFVQLARLLARQPDKQAAANMLSELAAKFPDLPEARFAHLAVAAEANDQAAVNEEFSRLAQIAPVWDLPVVWYADRLRRSDSAQAIGFLEQQLAARKQAGLEPQLMLIRLYAEQQRYAEAEQRTNLALQRFANHADLLNMSGLLHLQFGRFAKARQALEASLAANYSDPDALRLTLGQINEELKEPTLAMQWYKQVQPGNEYLLARLRLAQLEAEAGNWQQAIDDLKPLGSDAISAGKVVATQVQIARKQNDIEQGLALLDDALQRYPRSVQMLYDRSLLLEQQARIADAERDLRLILQIEPEHGHALNALGYMLTVHTQRYKEALVYIEKAHKQQPDDAMVLDSLGWVYFKLGKLEQALTHLQASYKRLQDPEIAAHLGEVLWQRGQRDEAKKLWQEGLKKDPQHKILRETMQRLMP